MAYASEAPTIRFAPWPPKGLSGTQLVLRVVTRKPGGTSQTVFTGPVSDDGRVVFDMGQLRAPNTAGLSTVEG